MKHRNFKIYIHIWYKLFLIPLNTNNSQFRSIFLFIYNRQALGEKGVIVFTTTRYTCDFVLICIIVEYYPTNLQLRKILLMKLQIYDLCVNAVRCLGMFPYGVQLQSKIHATKKENPCPYFFVHT